MKNIIYSTSFEQLWENEVEAKSRLNNKLFCITLLICNPASSIGFFLAEDPFFLPLLYTHCASSAAIIGLLLLNHYGRISGQKMTFYTQILLICCYAFLLAQPHRSYAQSCLNLTLGVIFAGLILRWPFRYALTSSVLSIFMYPAAIYMGEASLFRTFFEDGGVFVLIAQVLFPFVMYLTTQKDKREFYYRYNLEQKNETLERQKAITEQAMQDKSDFLSVMSHEIRTPLNGIVGIVHVMMEDKSNKENHEEFLETLKFSSDHLMAVVNNVLDFSKINSNNVQLNNASFDQALFFQNLRKTFLPKTDEKGIRLLFDTDKALPQKLFADVVRLNQIVTNLIHNAIKFTSRGYVKLTVCEKNRNNGRVTLRFAIADTGIGIPLSQQERIFKMFAQVRSDAHRENTGTGLGLAISKELLRLFNSTIVLKSEVGKGSVFSFEMDIAYSEDETARNSFKPEHENASIFPQAKVLIADDNKTNLTVASMLLKRRNILFEIASNGREAYEKFADGGFDLILMDLRMPIMDGFECTALIREIDDEIPVIALTASALESERERVMANGFTGFLTKPFVPDDFYNYIIPFLGSSKAKVHA